MPEPSLGLGLNGIVDWSTEQPFIDVFKTSREWVVNTPGQWGGIDLKDFAAAGHVDANGWVKDIPSGVTGVSTLILTELPADMTSAAGRYRLTYDGTGTLEVSGANATYSKGEIWFDYTPNGSNSVVLTITGTDPNHTGDYIRNIHVVHESKIDLFDAGEIFNPFFLDKVEDMRSLRFMDWMNTNNSTLVHWSDATHLSDSTWSKTNGASIELIVALANKTGTDPWINIPHLADDDLVRHYADYIRDNLDPKLKVNLEYSNEVWNFGFDQAQWANDQGHARWGNGVGDAWVQYYGMRAAQVADIFKGEFGAAASTRVNAIISTQTGWLGLEDGVLNAPNYVAEHPGTNKAPYLSFDSYAVSGYFGYDLGGDKAPMVRTWLTQSLAAATNAANSQGLTGTARTTYINAHKYDLARANAVKELRDGSLSHNMANTIKQLVSEIFPYQKQVADAHGLDMVMYEGGTHVVGIGSNVDDQALNDFFLNLNYSHEMAGLYDELLAGWKAAGGTMFNAFVDISAPDKWGSWGALRNIDDSTERWDALVKFNHDNPAWWDNSRDPHAFNRTNTTIGTAAANTLTGADAVEDLILGLDGNDTLNGASGSDSLFGGKGDDRLVGGSENDALFGGDGADVLLGGLGNDSMNGGADNDSLSGEDGNDALFAGLGIDTLSGGNGNDVLTAARGASSTSRFDGGAGFDTVSYVKALAGVTVDLGTPTLNTGDAAGDTHVSIEAITGTSFADLLRGNAVANKLQGNSGDDGLYGLSGGDTLLGGSGNDSLFGGAGADFIRGSSGNDTLSGDGDQDVLYGGTGADRFVFNLFTDAPVATPDTLRAGDGGGAFDGAGSAAGDLIDLRLIDANSVATGDQAFVFGTNNGKAGNLWVVTSGTSTILYGRVADHATADFAIVIEDGTAVSADAYTAADFLL